MKTVHYQPTDVCAREMIITVDGDTIVKIETIGGCQGNRQGVARLCEGRKIDEVISLLEGIKCHGSRTGETSCPDQLAKALKSLKD
ncbi:MAG: TIGR03905 family TSCPD domain-containing protein [Bacilli bacterium]|nr:TIGR03905 family TSCPD domain-containing protein [Bacilli bacterium]